MIFQNLFIVYGDEAIFVKNQHHENGGSILSRITLNCNFRKRIGSAAYSKKTITIDNDIIFDTIL